MNKIMKTTSDLQTSYHWSRVKHLRNRAESLIAQGSVNTDPRLVSLSNQILAHGIKISQLRRACRDNGSRFQAAFEEEPEHVTA